MKSLEYLNDVRSWYDYDRRNNLDNYLEQKDGHWKLAVFSILHHDFHQLNKGYGSKRYKQARKRNERKKKYSKASKKEKANAKMV